MNLRLLPSRTDPVHGRRASAFGFPGGARLVLLALLLVVAVPAAPGPVSAQGRQAIRGTVVEEGSERPIGGSFVALYDADDRRVAGGLTRDDGSFLIDVDAAGVYRVRAERIGFESTEASEVNVVPGRITRIDLVAPARAIVIEGVDVDGGRRCDLRPDEGRATLALWEEARKALEVALWADDRGRFIYDLQSWVRRYAPDGRRLESERLDQRTHVGRHGFRAISPETLVGQGFVQGTAAEGWDYFAPDAGVLMSDAFLGSHCFEVVQRDNRLGLEFSPVPDRDVADVEGILWFENGTSRLESLEYEYVNAPQAEDDRFGGEVVFEELPGGAWIVRRWEIRMPVLGVEERPRRQPRLVVQQVQSVGGEVLEVRDAVAVPPVRMPEANTGIVRGTVVDSTTGQPLAEAVVRVAGTNRTVRTADDGSFRMTGLPPDVFSFSFDHPRLRELAIPASPVAAEVQARETVEIQLGVPTVRGLVADACQRVGSEPATPSQASLGGVVLAPGIDPAELRVRVRWTGFERTAGGLQTRVEGADVQPDEFGRWGVCRIPRDEPVTVDVLHGEEAGAETRVGRMPAGGSRWLVVRAPEASTGGGGRAASIANANRPWKGQG